MLVPVAFMLSMPVAVVYEVAVPLVIDGFVSTMLAMRMVFVGLVALMIHHVTYLPHDYRRGLGKRLWLGATGTLRGRDTGGRVMDVDELPGNEST